MTKRFNPVLDMNIALINATLKVQEKGDRKAFSDTSKAQEDVKEYPVFIRCKITEDPTGINTDAEIQIKLRSADKVEVGQELVRGKDKFKVIGGQLTFGLTSPITMLENGSLLTLQLKEIILMRGIRTEICGYLENVCNSSLTEKLSSYDQQFAGFSFA